ncbi:FAD binding domain-containing protein [Massariosphaeria phaeospora]|uniref:FAD binding domain-containing protein n=1 Tax=Massariosphaeria phaeospora TaxID=100035 RepID=A0A7C8MF77_9PLEO|nr:FAD binding domain-containing protein [Massariosphaeria phaeospora]
MRTTLCWQLSNAVAIAMSSKLHLPMDQLSELLRPLLSGTVALSTEGPPRWSTFGAPQPNIVVDVTTEADVAKVVKYCSKNNIPFLAQNGGVGWAAFNLSNGVLINIAPLNEVAFSEDKTQAIVGGGASVKQTIDAAHAAGVLVVTGNCNCVGTIGAVLGGGYGNLIGEYGFGVDNVLSFNLVTARGELLNVSPTSHPDLFWAVRGAGPNFGIVTSAVMKAHPTSDRTAWNMALIFTPDKIKQVVQAVEDLRPQLLPAQNVFMYLTNSGPPDNQPVILVTGFLLQTTEEEARAAFSGVYAVGPLSENSGILPYDQWNTGGDAFCTREMRKPGHTIGISKLHPDQWQEIWDLYAEFRSKPGAENSVMIVEIYNLEKPRSIPESSSAFAHRDVNAQALVIPWYADPALDEEAMAFAKKVRGITGANEEKTTAYVNFAHGDEGLEAVYGESLPRLKDIKRQWDPKGRFNQWFPIK